MKIYLIQLFIIILLAIILSTISVSKKENIKKFIFIIIAFIMLFSVMGLRNKSVGVDTDLYCRIFKGFVHGTAQNNEMFETSTIYNMYNILVAKVLGPNSQNIILANSFLIVTLFLIFANKSSPNIYITTILYIILYFYLQGFNIARQMIAVLICATSMKYLVDRNLKRYVLLNVLAIFIHNTAIVIFGVGMLLYFIKNLNIKKIAFILFGTIITSFSLDKLMYVFVSIFPKYMYYMKTSSYEYGSGRKYILILVYILFLIIGLYAIYQKREKLSQEQYRKYMIYSTIVAISGVTGLLGSFSILVGRISLYFEIFIIIYIPLIIELIDKRKALWYFFIVVVLFIPFYVQLSGNISGVVPYKFY